MKALLAALKYRTDYDYDVSIQEIKQLADSCQIRIEEVMEQESEPHKATYVGKGKLLEISEKAQKYDCVIFNEELTPLQMRNISDVIDGLVMDRTDLILRIFEQRAKTKEAILQVEMARLNYEMPRLAGAHKEMYSQQGGSGFRGAGEQQIELERRHIRRRLASAKKELANVRKNRQTQRRHRSENDVVALVGYTNSGKSSLLNLFTDKKVISEDQLFATLQTSVRKVVLQKNKEVLMTDTVGFISQLPHSLIEAFKSTLEEVREADVIVFVIDSSSSYINEQIQVTSDVLKELGVKDTPILYAYNKIDLPHDVLVPKDPHVFISVKEKTGIETLEKEIIRLLKKDDMRLTLRIPYDEGDLYKALIHTWTLIREDFKDDGIYIVLELPSAYALKYQRYRV